MERRTRTSWSRRQWLAAAAGAAATGIGLDALAIEPRRLAVTHHTLGAGSGPTIRIAQLSDLHLRAVDAHVERVAAAVHDARPDLLLLTGDAIDRDDARAPLETVLGLLPTGPVRLAILGNWEHWSGIDLQQLDAMYERAGWQLLRNTSTRLAMRGTSLLVTGLDDLVGGRPDVRAALWQQAPAPNHLLLAHCPMHREVFMRDRAGPEPWRRPLAAGDPGPPPPQLMLAGHTHGGQVAIGPWAPMRPRGSGRYVAGWYRDAPTALYVSRGIGTSVIPVRFGASPEVAVFDWTLQPTPAVR